MNKLLSLSLFLSFSISLILLAGCSAADQPASNPSQTPIPPSSSAEGIEVTFRAVLEDGVCTFSGPVEVPVGNITVSFDNGGDRDTGPWVDHYLEGKTHADFLAEIHLGPMQSHPNPDWVKFPFYFTKDHQVWNIKLEEPGEYGLFVGSYNPWREYPCGAFQVVESETD